MFENTQDVIKNYKDLDDDEKEKVEAVYKAYREATGAKIWRGGVDGKEEARRDSQTGEPLITDESVEAIFNQAEEVSAKENTANAWATFTHYISVKNTSVEKAFDEGYISAAKGKNYLGGNLPSFAGLLSIQKKGWEAAAKVAAEVTVKACEEQASIPQAMRP
jgi:hypothetical protein